VATKPTTRAPAAAVAKRSRDADATQRAILDAAVAAFARSGYDGASTREIARDAGIDPRLITRYFGSKERLFERAVEETYRHPLTMSPGHTRAAAEALLSDAPLAQSQGLLLTLRSAANERAAEIMRGHLETHFQRQLADDLPGVEPVARAALLISICAGVQLMRNVLGNRSLLAETTEVLVTRLTAALDAIAVAPSAETG